MKKAAKKLGQSLLIVVVTLVVWAIVVLNTGLYDALMFKRLILLVGLILIVRLWFIGWDNAGEEVTPDETFDDTNEDAETTTNPMEAFQQECTDLQKAAILQSLLAMGGADGKFSAAEETYLFQTANLLGYDLIANRDSVVNLGTVGHTARLSLSESQKHWFIVALVEMANVDKFGLDKKQTFFAQLISSLGVSSDEAEAVLEKSLNVMTAFANVRSMIK